MSENKAKELLDLALHPVRMRILMLLAGSRGLTPLQMAERMDDIPQATLYRHINRLAKAGLLSVREERPVRGTVEKVYVLNTTPPAHAEQGEDALQEFNRMSKEDHLRYFTAFTTTLLDDFARYLNPRDQGPLDLVSDGVGYQKTALYLSDEEFAAFAAALNQALLPFLGNESAPGRKKRLFSTIMMPSDDDQEAAGGTNEN